MVVSTGGAMEADSGSQYDFSSMGPILMAGLMGMLFAGLVQIFMPFSHTADLVYSLFGVVLFSGYSACLASSPRPKACAT